MTFLNEEYNTSAPTNEKASSSEIRRTTLKVEVEELPRKQSRTAQKTLQS